MSQYNTIYVKFNFYIFIRNMESYKLSLYQYSSKGLCLVGRGFEFPIYTTFISFELFVFSVSFREKNRIILSGGHYRNFAAKK